MILGVEIEPLAKKPDDRGWLLKLLMNAHICGNKEFGEIYVTVAHPAAVKGAHYHEHCTEWFCVIRGYAKLVLFDRRTQERLEITMGEENMVRVRVPPHVAHAVKNIGDDLMYLLAYADREYDPQHPDTIPFPLDFD